MRSRPISSLLFVAATLAACSRPPAPPPVVERRPAWPPPDLVPPVAAQHPVSSSLHGETRVDDYAWLREKGTPEVEAYLRAERAYAEAYTRPSLALQEKLYGELVSRLEQTDSSAPYRARGYWYYTRTEEGRQYPAHCRKKGTRESREEVLLDVNAMATGKAFLSVEGLTPSPDSTLLAYRVDDSGFRQYTLRVRDLTSGADRPDAIARVTSFAWFNDSRTLLYVVEDATTKRPYQVYRHVLGGGRDELVYEEKDARFRVFVRASRDRQLLFVTSASATTSEVRFVPADVTRGGLTLVEPREQGHEYYADHRAGKLWIRTNSGGPNFRLVTTPLEAPARRHWKELLAHRDDVMLEAVELFRDFYVLLEREGGLPQVRVVDLAKPASAHRVAFEEAAFSVRAGDNLEFEARSYRFTYESPTTPPSVYDYDPFKRTRRLVKETPVPGYDGTRYEVELSSARAADGAAVPVWLLHRKGLVKDGRNPTLLYGYGAYGASMSARFDPSLPSLLERGVVYATAYVRGGGELGKRWHEQGRMAAKPNTFSDFIAVAEHLVAQGYTSPAHLAIEGRSAGGLLVGAVLNARPELFALVIAKVPFVDVLNTMLDESLPLTVGEFEEWGDPRVKEQYDVMRSYSPYDNVAARPYPALLVETSYNDSQVMYWEPAKWVARLRARGAGERPIVFRVELDPAGHGGRSGRYDRLHDLAFDYAFLLWQLGVETPEETITR
jgi:oligopeptidase B